MELYDSGLQDAPGVPETLAANDARALRRALARALRIDIVEAMKEK